MQTVQNRVTIIGLLIGKAAEGGREGQLHLTLPIALRMYLAQPVAFAALADGDNKVAQ